MPFKKKEVGSVVSGIPPAETKAEYVTVEQFNSLQSSVMNLVDLLQKKTATPEEVKVEKEITKASPDYTPINPEWEEKAREIIGEALDHCEVFYPKGGGIVFTVVIKNDHSNAPMEYLKMHKVDRRSKDIGNTGTEGVENWCKLIKKNLDRKK